MHAIQDASHKKDPRHKLLAIEEEISRRLFEREEEIRGFLCSLIARKHVLFLGPKGSAKSNLSRLLCDAISWKPVAGASPNAQPYFRAQLGHDSTADEIFGPTSNAGFKEDSFRRQTAGMITESRIASIDEIFDAPPSLLRKMNTVLNEGTFKNGTDPEVPVPLELLVGASNFTPDPDANLDAFFDRFLLRYETRYLKDPRNFRAMLMTANEGRKADSIEPMICEEELAEARSSASRVDSGGILSAIDELAEKLKKEGIELSDRRYYGLISIIKAHAYLEGRNEAAREDLALLKHAAWEDPMQIGTVSRVVLSVATPQTAKAQDIFDDLSEACRRAIRASDELDYKSATEDEKDRVSGIAIDARGKCIHATRKLFELRESARERGQDTKLIDRFLNQTGDLKAEVDTKCFGTT